MFKKKEKPASVADALRELRQTEDMLVKKQEHLESKIDKEFKIAKTNASKNKQAAIQALKRKKKYEKQLQQVDGTLTTIEMQRHTLEDANINTTVLKSLKNAAAVLKNANLKLDVAEVNSLVDDIADQHDLADEIAMAISMPIGFENVDEDEIEKELEELEQEVLDEKVLAVPEKYELPAQVEEGVSRPKSGRSSAKLDRPKSSRKNEEDEDIRKLENWAS